MNAADNKEFLDNVKASSFEYKNPNLSTTNEGKNFGVMAQDMQKSKVGRDLVHEGPSGNLQFNRGKAVNLALASLAFLNERINKIEKGSKKK